MTYLYPLSDFFHICLCMAAMICAALQTAALVYMLLRNTAKSPKQICANVFHFSFLLQSLTILVLLAQTRMDMSLLLPIGRKYIILRYLVFSFVAGSCILYAFILQKFFCLLSVPFCAVTLPVFEFLPNKLLIAWLCFFLAVMSVRALIIIKRCRNDIKNSLSKNSVKNAVDELHSGILFCERNGKILLINTVMQNLMLSLYNEIFRNGSEFWKKLGNATVSNGCTATKLDDKTVFILPDGKVWLFNKCIINNSGNRYVQVSAADVTEQWKLTRRLENLQAKLQKRETELKEMIENIEHLCHEEEMLKIKSRFHDVLGQRLALLFRSLREDLEPDEKLLYDFASGMLAELYANETVVTAEDRLKTLSCLMEEIGVTLIVKGRLPKGESLGLLFADIITEATTNSVRHGMASQVYVEIEQKDGFCLLCITDNGIPPKEPVCEGGGLSSIRNKVQLFDGQMTVSAEPKFTLLISVPGGETP